MSKVKKKRAVTPIKTSERDTNFEKIIRFSGWLFLLTLVGFFGAWIALDWVLEIVDLELSAITFTFIIFIGTNSAISFALATKIKNNRERKKQFFHDWLLGEFIFGILAIFAIAAYVW
ncbi:MAG: hypothetical protein JSV62_15250 [Promethearchaeota archaeon]|nr:MAG: hypothetical protein JSV62_15250 [Candidatus Lokiarchaeota archaeon]